MSLLKPLRWPRFWLALWLLAITVVWVLCLVALPPVAELPSGSDKVQHFLAYFVLAGSAVQIFRQRITLWWVVGTLVVMGVAIEGAQAALTATRMADPLDVLANTGGVAAGIALAWTPLRDLLLRLEPRRR